MQEIAKMAFFDPRKLFNSNGSRKLISEIDDHSAASIAGSEVCELFDGTGDQKHAYGLLKKMKLARQGEEPRDAGATSSSSPAIEDPDDANRITTLIIDLWEPGSSVRCY
jgi:hypothetical protein